MLCRGSLPLFTISKEWTIFLGRNNDLLWLKRIYSESGILRGKEGFQQLIALHTDCTEKFLFLISWCTDLISISRRNGGFILPESDWWPWEAETTEFRRQE
jgi:hypothetical protein